MGSHINFAFKKKIEKSFFEFDDGFCSWYVDDVDAPALCSGHVGEATTIAIFVLPSHVDSPCGL